MNKKDVGILGEKLALNYLKKRGYKIVEKNYRCKAGEIDLVATEKDYLVFIEVRTKTSSYFGRPSESITYVKKKKLITLAFTYLGAHYKINTLWRIDFIAIELDNNGVLKNIELIENAIS